MGNCVFKGSGVADEKVIKVVTPNGGVMELQAPITAATITNEFPGYAIFLSPAHHHNPPLLHHEHLSAGHSYHLLPLGQQPADHTTTDDHTLVLDMPYRMSVDNVQPQGMSKMRQSHLPPPDRDQPSAAAPFPRYNTNTRSRGVWKVRLAINSDQLSDILSQDARTEALIESVRTVAKCASGIPSPVNSEHRSWTTAASEISSTDHHEIYQL